MKRASVVITLIAICALLSAAAAVAQEVTEKPLSYRQVKTSDGAALYGELCAVCHGATGKGDGPAAQALAITVPDLTALAAENGGIYPAQQVERTITGETETAAHGSREMPMWGHALSDVRPDWSEAHSEGFARTRIKNLVEHIESLQAKP